jgi:tetratricopeptide (TPR) repeat protein
MRRVSLVHVGLWLALGVAGAAPALRAQSVEFSLDEDGNWVQVDAPEAGTDEALIAKARRLLAEEQPNAAREILAGFIDAHKREGHPLLAEAYLLRGDAWMAGGKEYQALYDYEVVTLDYPATDSFVTAVQRELDIGVRYVNGLKRKFAGVRILSAEDVGEELLIRVQERLPGSRAAERAGIELADYYFRQRDMEMAAIAYDLFLELYPKSEYRIDAMKRRVYSTIARFKGPRYDGSPLIDAQVLIDRFSRLYPAEAQKAGLDDALATRLDESAANSLLQTAQWYIRRGETVAGRYTLQRLVKEHPRTAAAARALETLEERGWVEPLSEASAAPVVEDRPVTSSSPDESSQAAESGREQQAASTNAPAPAGRTPQAGGAQ